MSKQGATIFRINKVNKNLLTKSNYSFFYSDAVVAPQGLQWGSWFEI